MEEEEYEDEWERGCSRCRAINHAALQSCRNDNALERHVLRTFSLHRRVTSRLPLPLSWMMRMRMSFLSSYQHLGTQSQGAYHDDGVAPFQWIGIEQRQ